MRLFIVGQVQGPGPCGTAWDFQGVFSTEEAAVAACRDETYFVGPAELDQELPHETTTAWPGGYFPKIEENLHG